METNKPLSDQQIEQLKAAIRARFDALYQRIGTNRQKLSTTVLTVDQAITKVLAKETIDGAREKAILAQLRDIERTAANQLPHLPKQKSNS